MKKAKMTTIQLALQLALECTYADEMTESAKEYLRDLLKKALEDSKQLRGNI